MNMQKEDLIEMRLDKWLKVARIYKKRELSVQAIENGSVKVNGDKVKPAKQVKIGDLLTVRIGTQYRELTILGLTEKSLSPKLARELYDEKIPAGKQGDILELLKIYEAQERENRKEWKKTKDNKKHRRAMKDFKYGKE